MPGYYSVTIFSQCDAMCLRHYWTLLCLQLAGKIINEIDCDMRVTEDFQLVIFFRIIFFQIIVGTIKGLSVKGNLSVGCNNLL